MLLIAHSARLVIAPRLLVIALVGGAALQAADPPREVVEFFQSVTRALADAHSNRPELPNAAAGFLDYFDKNMPNYAQLRANVEDLASRVNVGSALEFVEDSGDAEKRALDVDWVLEIPDRPTRRKVLKITIEKRGKHWKITSLDDSDFFKY